jgi:HSP20 family protein
MLVKWNPRRSLFDTENEFDRAMRSFFNWNYPFHRGSDNAVDLRVDVEENENEYRLSAELPGMKHEDISVTLADNVLTLSGEKKSEKEVNENNCHCSERRYGKFSRSFNFSNTVSSDKISADYKEGVLYITVPKAEEAKPKQIEIKVK